MQVLQLPMNSLDLVLTTASNKIFIREIMIYKQKAALKILPWTVITLYIQELHYISGMLSDKEKISLISKSSIQLITFASMAVTSQMLPNVLVAIAMT